jgi:hypothetical protein
MFYIIRDFNNKIYEKPIKEYTNVLMHINIYQQVNLNIQKFINVQIN